MLSLFILYKNIPQAAAGYAARIGLAPVSLIAPFIGKYHYQRTASSRGWTPPSVSGTDPAAPCLCFNGDGHFLTSSFQPEQAYLRASAGQLRRPPTSCGIVHMSMHDCCCLSKYVSRIPHMRSFPWHRGRRSHLHSAVFPPRSNQEGETKK